VVSVDAPRTGPASLMHVASYRVTVAREEKSAAPPKQATAPKPDALKPAVTPATKPAKIATTGDKARLPGSARDAKPLPQPAKPGASRDTGTD